MKFTRKKPKTILGLLFRYFFVGGTAAIVDIVFFMWFVHVWNIDYRVAAFLSFSLGTFINFLLCYYWLFKKNKLSFWRLGGRHYSSSCGGVLTNEIVLIFLMDGMGCTDFFLAKIIATGSAFIVNFMLINFFAFNDKILLLRKKVVG